VARLRITTAAQLSTTTVTTGIITEVYTVLASDVVNFATRFGNTFDEYRIVGADFRVRQVGANTGVSAMWFDEKSTAIPTVNEAQERSLSLYSNSNASSRTMIVHRWRARDLLDLQFISVTVTNVGPVTFKIFTNSVTYGSPIAATPIWLVEPEFYFEFRGIASS
jgi:hypothetical protein